MVGAADLAELLAERRQPQNIRAGRISSRELQVSLLAQQLGSSAFHSNTGKNGVSLHTSSNNESCTTSVSIASTFFTACR